TSRATTMVPYYVVATEHDSWWVQPQTQAPKLWMQQISTCVPAKALELRWSRCSMLLLQCLAVGLYNTKPLTSKLRNSSCVPAKPLELRRRYLIMLLLQSMAPSGYSRNPQAPKLCMQQISTCVPAKPLEL